MIKKIAVTALMLMTSLVSSGFATEPLLAPVDPLAWAVANADWGPYGGAQIESLRKIVNGQVTAHQVNSSYTDPVEHVVKRIKCSDPANCVMCSKDSLVAARKLRDQVSGSAAGAQGMESVYAAMATYAQARADAMSAQARWNKARNESTITETTMVDGQEVVTTKTVAVENNADLEMQNASQIMQKIAQNAQMQSQQQGNTVYSYIDAASQSLKTPEPAVELYVGKDPLK